MRYINLHFTYLFTRYSQFPHSLHLDHTRTNGPDKMKGESPIVNSALSQLCGQCEWSSSLFPRPRASSKCKHNSDICCH